MTGVLRLQGRRIADPARAKSPEDPARGKGRATRRYRSQLVADGAQEALARGSSGICVFSLNSLSSDSTWMLRNFWDQTGHPDYPIDSAVFHRVLNDEGSVP